MGDQPTLFDLRLDPEDDVNLHDKFWQYHKDNPEVYEMICRFVNEAIASGRDHLGISLIFERIRWYTMIEARGKYAEGFKINNSFRAFYARLWMKTHPEYPVMFETRRQRYDGAEESTL